jgi:hypothetical protein
MDQNYLGVQSPQPTPTTEPFWVPDIFNDPIEDVPQEPHNTCTHFVFMAIYTINGNVFTDQTGRFPITSNCSQAYVVVFYIFDANAIQSVPIKNCSKRRQPVIIWNPQLVQPSLPTLNHNNNNISSNCNTPAIVEDNSDKDSPISYHSTCPPCHHLICPLKNRPLTRNQLRLCTAHMINCVIVDKLMPTPSLCTHPPLLHRGYAFAAESILLETIFTPSYSTVQCIGTIIDDDTGDVLEYQHLMKIDKHKQVWAHSFTNEIGPLFQGIKNVPGTDTCYFIPKSHVPAHKRPTYGRICCNYQPQKEEKYCVRLTIGCNHIDYSGNKSTPTANLTMAKLLINSTSVPLGPSFWASTSPISTSTPPCQNQIHASSSQHDP